MSLQFALISIGMAVIVIFLGWCIYYLRKIRLELGSMWQEEEVFPEDPEDPDEPNIFKPVEN